MNRWTGVGRLTRDPETRYTEGDKPMTIAKYGLAVQRPARNGAEPETDFFNITAFGRAGEFAEKYLHKGMKILVSGPVRTGSYTNRDGVKVHTTEIVAESQEFCEGKKDGAKSGDGFAEIPDDTELPFN